MLVRVGPGYELADLLAKTRALLSFADVPSYLASPLLRKSTATASFDSSNFYYPDIFGYLHFSYPVN